MAKSLDKMMSDAAALQKIIAQEPIIVINGVQLTPFQAATIRVGMESWASDLSERGCGDDAHGRSMKKGYLKAMGEIRKALYKEKS